MEDAALTGSTTKRRALLSDLLANFGSAVDASLTGTITSTLPVFFPSESAFRGNIQVGGALSADTAGGLAVNGTLAGNQFVVVPADLFAVAFTKLSPLANLELLIDGIDTFLLGLQEVLDGEVFEITLPLVGDKLAGAAQFIEDFREGFIADFREAIETSATPDQNFVSPAAGAANPSGLNSLRDRDGNGSVNIGDIQLTPPTPLKTGSIRATCSWNGTSGWARSSSGCRRRHRLRSGDSGPGPKRAARVDVNVGWQPDFGFGVDLSKAST